MGDRCFGRSLSDVSIKLLKWGWPIVASVVLIIGIVLTSVGHGNADNALYAGGILTIFGAIAIFVFWGCYQCNVGGIRDPGCINNRECMNNCCQRTSYGEL